MVDMATISPVLTSITMPNAPFRICLLYTSKTESEASELLSAKSITYRTVGNGSVVTDQLPSAGQEVPGHSEIVLYMGEEKVTEKTTVPNFIGYGVADVNWLANQYRCV